MDGLVLVQVLGERIWRRVGTEGDQNSFDQQQGTNIQCRFDSKSHFLFELLIEFALESQISPKKRDRFYNNLNSIAFAAKDCSFKERDFVNFIKELYEISINESPEVSLSKTLTLLERLKPLKKKQKRA